MSQQLKAIKVIPLKTAWKNNLPVAINAPVISVINKPKEKNSSNRTLSGKRQATKKQLDEKKIKLPEQPKGYIKCPPYDFF